MRAYRSPGSVRALTEKGAVCGTVTFYAGDHVPGVKCAGLPNATIQRSSAAPLRGARSTSASATAAALTAYRDLGRQLVAAVWGAELIERAPRGQAL
jgi:hypothetical protein